VFSASFATVATLSAFTASIFMNPRRISPRRRLALAQASSSARTSAGAVRGIAHAPQM
jgi:hypothetical protein